MKTTNLKMNEFPPVAIPATDHLSHAHEISKALAILYPGTVSFLANPLPGNTFRL